MQFWLKENDSSTFMLPINPSEYTISSGNTVTTLNINEIGEIALYSGNKLYSITISSFFPRQVYNFCNYRNILLPEAYIEKIEKWRSSGTVIRLIITGSKINIPVLIENFRYGERDGTRDIYYEIILREYKYLKVLSSNDSLRGENSSRAVELSKTRGTYTVVEGDSLWDIAVKYYGNGAKYLNIVNANKDKIKNPNLIHAGQVLIIP